MTLGGTAVIKALMSGRVQDMANIMSQYLGTSLRETGIAQSISSFFAMFTTALYRH